MKMRNKFALPLVFALVCLFLLPMIGFAESKPLTRQQVLNQIAIERMNNWALKVAAEKQRAQQWENFKAKVIADVGFVTPYAIPI